MKAHELVPLQVMLPRFWVAITVHENRRFAMTAELRFMKAISAEVGAVVDGRG